MKVITDKDFSLSDKMPEIPDAHNQQKDKYHFDKLKLYYGEPYVVKQGEGKSIVINQPTMGQIFDFGELDFLQTVRIFTTNTTENRVMLWDGALVEIKAGKPFAKRYNWNKMSDYELFLKFLPHANQKVLDILFEDFKLSNLKRLDADDGSQLLIDAVNDIIIDEKMYDIMSNYIRTMFHIFPKEERVKGRTAQNTIISVERSQMVDKRNQDKATASYYLPFLSYYLCHPGTNITKADLRDVGVYEFMYNLQRLQIYDKSIATLHGLCGGLFFDVKKVKPEEYNAMRDI